MVGLTSTGFERKRLADIITSLKSRAQARWGSSINVDADSVIGQLIGVFSPELDEVWQLAETVHNSFNPSNCEDAELDSRCALNGITRLEAVNSTVPAMLYIVEPNTIPAGTTFSVDVTGERFTSDTAVEYTGVLGTDELCGMIVYLDLADVVNGHTYTIDITNLNTLATGVISYTADGSATADEIKAGLVAAWIANTTCPWETVYTTLGVPQVGAFGLMYGTTSSTAEKFIITAIDSKLQLLGGLMPVNCTAVNSGAIVVESLSLNTIETPVSGLQFVLNLDAGVTGTARETNTSLRMRRAKLLAIAGTATVDAIIAAVGSLDSVTQVVGLENTTGSVDANGLPTKSFEIIIEGGDTADIAQAIFDTRPIGIESYGSTTVPIADTQGVDHDTSFSRPTLKYIHINVDYTRYTEEEFSDGAESAMKDAIIAYAANNFPIGRDVIPQRFIGSIYSAVTGLQDLDITIDATANPGDTPTLASAIEAMGVRDLAQFDLSRITLVDVT